jgi:hypothetical protein
MICDRNGVQRWSAVWQGLPWVAHPHHFKMPDMQKIANGPRCRPYIDYVKGFTRATGMNFTNWRVRDNPGFIQLNSAEMDFAAAAHKAHGDFVVVEPLVKESANPNKKWGVAKWQGLVALLAKEGFKPVQLGAAGTAILPGATHIVTPDFRYGAAVMKFARWSFLPDGGLHHAAGVLGLPATVLWGGVNPPEILGYPAHENIAFPVACGTWVPCSHCRTIWNWLSPQYVLARTIPKMVERYGEDFRSR